MMSANSHAFKRLLVVVAALAMGLFVAVLVINPMPAKPHSVAMATENEDCLAALGERSSGFDFVDHELRYAGAYRLVTRAERATGFDFVDHELRYAGGYGIVTPGKRSAGFDFVDHELRYAGGYGLVSSIEKACRH